MLLVFEGPDGAGKTTLLQAVHRKLAAMGRPAVVYRNIPRPNVVIGWPDAHVVHAEYNALTHFDLSKIDVLKDRFWVTDHVYSKVFLRDPYDRGYVNPVADFKDQVLQVHVNVNDWRVLAERRKIRPYDDMYDFVPQLSWTMKEYFTELWAGMRQWTHHLTLYTDAGVTTEQLADAVVSVMEGRR